MPTKEVKGKPTYSPMEVKRYPFAPPAYPLMFPRGREVPSRENFNFAVDSYARKKRWAEQFAKTKQPRQESKGKAEEKRSANLRRAASGMKEMVKGSVRGSAQEKKARSEGSTNGRSNGQASDPSVKRVRRRSAKVTKSQGQGKRSRSSSSCSVEESVPARKKPRSANSVIGTRKGRKTLPRASLSVDRVLAPCHASSPSGYSEASTPLVPGYRVLFGKAVEPVPAPATTKSILLSTGLIQAAFPTSRNEGLGKRNFNEKPLAASRSDNSNVPPLRKHTQFRKKPPVIPPNNAKPVCPVIDLTGSDSEAYLGARPSQNIFPVRPHLSAHPLDVPPLRQVHQTSMVKGNLHPAQSATRPRESQGVQGARPQDLPLPRAPRVSFRARSMPSAPTQEKRDPSYRIAGGCAHIRTPVQEKQRQEALRRSLVSGVDSRREGTLTGQARSSQAQRAQNTPAATAGEATQNSSQVVMKVRPLPRGAKPVAGRPELPSVSGSPTFNLPTARERQQQPSSQFPMACRGAYQPKEKVGDDLEGTRVPITHSWARPGERPQTVPTPGVSGLHQNQNLARTSPVAPSGSVVKRFTIRYDFRRGDEAAWINTGLSAQPSQATLTLAPLPETAKTARLVETDQNVARSKPQESRPAEGFSNALSPRQALLASSFVLPFRKVRTLSGLRGQNAETTQQIRIDGKLPAPPLDRNERNRAANPTAVSPVAVNPTAANPVAANPTAANPVAVSHKEGNKLVDHGRRENIGHGSAGNIRGVRLAPSRQFPKLLVKDYMGTPQPTVNTGIVGPWLETNLTALRTQLRALQERKDDLERQDARAIEKCARALKDFTGNEQTRRSLKWRFQYLSQDSVSNIVRSIAQKVDFPLTSPALEVELDLDTIDDMLLRELEVLLRREENPGTFPVVPGLKEICQKIRDCKLRIFDIEATFPQE